jgi:predicted RNA binding protein YcfA (HicA-like mRNA interferase family)|nr:type II toxin-antitoxin system HicA family toxin [Sporomusa sp. KB1]
MKVRDILKLIMKDGWYEIEQKGSHRQFKHPVKQGKVTIPIHGTNDDLTPKTEKSILKQAGLI